MVTFGFVMTAVCLSPIVLAVLALAAVAVDDHLRGN